MKTKLTLFALGLMIAFMSCKKEEALPVSTFTFTVNSTKAPVTASFINNSQNADTYLWNFGDGTSSAEKNPVHVYTTQGQYTIALEAKSGSGNTNSSVQYITVLKPDEPLPAVSFSFTVNSQYAPCIATFTNNTTNAVSYSWNFGDGNSSTDKNPTHTYANQGQYTVTLEATNADGKTASANMAITVQKANLPLPVVDFTFTGNTAFAPCLVTFNNLTTNAVSYVWNFGDGPGSYNAKNPTHVFMAGGSYKVTLTATNADGASANIFKYVTVTMAPTKVTIKQVTLMSFAPTAANGVGWDSGSGPDPYFEFGPSPSGTAYYSSEYFSDISVANLPKTYLACTINITNINAANKISLFDEDLFGSEAMGEISFPFSNFIPANGEAYPTQIFLENTSWNLKFKLAIEWKP